MVGTVKGQGFLVVLTAPDGTTVTTSTSVITLTTAGTAGNLIGGTFTLEYDGKTTPALRPDINTGALKTALENLHTPKRTVEVRRVSNDALTAGAGSYVWTIEFTSHLEKWTATTTPA